MTQILNGLRQRLLAPRPLALIVTGAVLIAIGLFGTVRGQAVWTSATVNRLVDELQQARFALLVGGDLPLELVSQRIGQGSFFLLWQQKRINILTSTARFNAASSAVRAILCRSAEVRVADNLVGGSSSFAEALRGAPEQNIVGLQLGTPAAKRLTGIDAMHLITQMQPRKLAQGGTPACR